METKFGVTVYEITLIKRDGTENPRLYNSSDYSTTLLTSRSAGRTKRRYEENPFVRPSRAYYCLHRGRGENTTTGFSVAFVRKNSNRSTRIADTSSYSPPSLVECPFILSTTPPPLDTIFRRIRVRIPLFLLRSSAILCTEWTLLKRHDMSASTAFV